MMKTDGGNVILSPMPIKAIGKHFSGFVITPKRYRYWFIYRFRHILSAIAFKRRRRYKTIINPKI